MNEQWDFLGPEKREEHDDKEKIVLSQENFIIATAI